MVDKIILTAQDGFVVYDLESSKAIHFKSFNWTSINTKQETTEGAIKEFENLKCRQ